MKIVSILFVIAFSISFSGSSQSSALMNALNSQQAEILSGDQGVAIIFIQSRDGISTVRNVEALDTLYLLAAQGLDQTLVFEADKTNKPLYLLRYRFINDIWAETARYNPAELPEIDFQKAHRLVKEYSGKHKSIASIAVFYGLIQGGRLIVSFQIKDDASELCEQWLYDVAADDVSDTPQSATCFFNMDG